MLALYMSLIDDTDDKKTFEYIYNLKKTKVFAIAYSILKNKATAEEACSEVFLNIAKSFQKVKNLDPHKLDRYIVVTVRNVSLNMLKKEKMHREVLVLNEDTVSDLSDGVLVHQNYKHIVACIKQLSYTDQEILYLRISLGLAYKDIANALDISAAAARQRFVYAKTNLARVLDKKEGDL